MIQRGLLILIASAGSALADVPLLTLSLAGESLTLPEGSPVAAEVAPGADGLPAVYARLPGPEAARFAEMTGRHVGQVVTVGLCGETLMEARLQTPIPDGALVITGDPTAQTADRIVARLTAGRCDAP